MKLSKEAQHLIEVCIRGGNHAYYWILRRATGGEPEQKKTHWFDTSILVNPPNYGEGYNLYFGLYPTNEIPSRTGKGGAPLPKESVRAGNADISAITCLWGDCDEKDGWTQEKVNELLPEASLIVSTGGGWQVYWFLDKPYPVNDTNRAEIQGIVKRWVKYIGGDPGAVDLARIFRVPGSLNYKYDPPRQVEIYRADTGARYNLADLAALLPPEEAPQGETSRPAAPMGSIETSAHNLVKAALERWIAEEGGRNKAGYKLACQLRDLRISKSEAEQYMMQFVAVSPAKDHRYTKEEALESLNSAYKSTPREQPQGKNELIPPRAKDKAPIQKTPQNTQILPQGGTDNNNLSEPEFEPLPGTTEAPQGGETQRARYTLRTAGDALKPQPPIEYIVDKLLTVGSVAVFYGEPGSKKTYSLVSMAVCVASGFPWINFKTKKSPVLIVDEENGEVRTARRLSEALKGEMCDDTTPLYYVSLAGFKMDDENDPIILQSLIEETGAKLVILDPLAAIMSGDENSKEDTQPIFTTLRRIADKTGAAIVIIHHSNKAGGYRGSSAIKGAVDLMVKVESEDGKNIIDFQSEKNRDGDPQKWTALASWLDAEGTFNLRAWTTEKDIHFRKSDIHVMDYLTEHGPSTTPDITNSAATCSSQDARQAIFRLASAGKIRRINPGDKVAQYELVTSVTSVTDV